MTENGDRIATLIQLSLKEECCTAARDSRAKPRQVENQNHLIRRKLIGKLGDNKLATNQNSRNFWPESQVGES